MILRGEEIIVGVGVEDPNSRGVGVAPQHWFKATTPTGIVPIVEKIALKETLGTKIASNSTEIRQIRAEGDIETYVRAIGIGFLLKPLLGKVTSGTKVGESAVYEHLFEVLPHDPEHPSLTVALHQPDLQDYYYPLAVVVNQSLELTTEDAAKVVNSIIAAGESEKAGDAYAPDIQKDEDSKDYLFRHQDVTIKIAANVSALAAAPSLLVKSYKQELPNGGRADQNVGEETIGNVLATGFDMKGSFELDLANVDLHDAYLENSFAALQISMVRDDITIGTGSHPSIVITFPKVSIMNWKPNRPIDEIAKEGIDFSVLYDSDEEEAINVLVTNTRANYDAADVES